VAAVIFLDTHVLVWLYLPRLDLLGQQAVRLINREDLAVSPVVLLELEYLHEIGRLVVHGGEVVEELGQRLGLAVSSMSFESVVRHAVKQTWTRDPFDRIIVGQAAATKKRLVTRDKTIRDNYSRAVW